MTTKLTNKQTQRKKKIVITGAAGLVGLNLLVLLQEKLQNKFYGESYEIVAFDRNAHNIHLAQQLFPSFDMRVADISKKGQWMEALKGASCVIQLQAQISSPHSQPYIDNNITSVQHVLEACTKHKVKHLIHLSSSVVISIAKDHYTNTKRKGEELVASSIVPHTILRPPLMYGCFDIKHLGFLTPLLEKSPVFPMPGSGKYLRQPLFVEDLCAIILKFIDQKPLNTVHNIIGKERIMFIDLLKIIAEEKKLRRLFVRIPIPLFITLLRMHGFLTGKKPFISDQLKALTAGDEFPVTDWDKVFGVPYTPFREGIRKTFRSPYHSYRLKLRSFE